MNFVSEGIGSVSEIVSSEGDLLQNSITRTSLHILIIFCVICVSDIIKIYIPKLHCLAIFAFFYMQKNNTKIAVFGQPFCDIPTP